MTSHWRSASFIALALICFSFEEVFFYGIWIVAVTIGDLGSTAGPQTSFRSQPLK